MLESKLHHPNPNYPTPKPLNVEAGARLPAGRHLTAAPYAEELEPTGAFQAEAWTAVPAPVADGTEASVEACSVA